MVDYNETGEPTGITFTVKVGSQEIPFRLPANVQKVEQIFINMRVKKPEKWNSDYEQVMKRIQKQASMTAWRTIKDWIDAQMAFIETDMVTLQELFLPYVQLQDGMTLYRHLETRGFKQIPERL
jgi:hypothetical protein